MRTQVIWPHFEIPGCKPNFVRCEPFRFPPNFRKKKDLGEKEMFFSLQFGTLENSLVDKITRTTTNFIYLFHWAKQDTNSKKEATYF